VFIQPAAHFNRFEPAFVFNREANPLAWLDGKNFAVLHHDVRDTCCRNTVLDRLDAGLDRPLDGLVRRVSSIGL
jgi:hypothetical protein